MADTEKPVILLVHGAWHNPGHLRELTADIKAEGFIVLTPSLATAGFGDSIDTASQLDDARRLTDAVKPHLEQGRNVVGIAHSYGAFPLAHAINGLTAKERAKKGLKGGFSAAIFISPMPTFQSGVSAVEASGGKWLGDWFFTPTDTRLELKMELAGQAFYNDIEEAKREAAIAHLGSQSILPYKTTIVCTPAELDLPKRLIACANDTIFPRDLQIMTAEKWGATVVELESGHSPWMRDDVRPKVVEVVVEVARRT